MEPLSILLVDDAADIGTFMKMKLAREAPDMSFHFVGGGRECLKYIEDNKVDCILSDYQMPGMNGMELLLELRSQGSNIPFIFLTGQGNEEVAREAFKNGAYDYFTKESGFAHFARIINSVVQAVRHHHAEKSKQMADESLQLFRNLLNRTSEAIFVTDPATGRFLLVNDKACSSLGYVREKLLSLRTLDIENKFPDQASWDAHVNELKSKGHIILEGEQMRSDGASFPVEVNVTYMTLGERDYMVAVAHDITKRKLYEHNLQEAEVRYRTVFDQSPDGILIVDDNGKFIEFNEAAHSQLGYSREEFAKLRIADIDPVESLEEIQIKMKEILEKGKAEFDVKHMTKGGEIRDVHIINQMMVLSGRPVVHSIWRDITERKKADDALLEEKNKLDSILGSIGDAISIQDTGFRILYQNPAHIEHIGEHTGEYCYKAYHNLDMICNECQVAQCFEDGKPHTLQKSRNTDKGQAYFEIKASPVRDSSGRIIAAVESVRDITERKQAEEALARNLNMQKAILDNIPYMAWLKDVDGRFIAVNESVANSSGLTPEDIIGKTEYDFFDREVADKCRETDSETIKSGKRSVFEEPLLTKDGNTVVLESIKTPIFNGAGDIIGTVGIARDITEGKELERQRSDFYAMITHDIKSPLTAILGYVDMLTEMPDTQGERVAPIINSISSSCGKLVGLFEDFIAISRIEAGDLRLSLYPHDMRSVLEEVLAGLGKAVQAKGIAMNLHVPEVLTCSVLMDQKLMHRALYNLVQNAVNYTAAGGAITVGVGKKALDGKDFIVVSVADTGQGIPVEEQHKVFGKYYRSPMNKDVKGTGLGLFIVKRAAEAHGGCVELESEVGKGSTFSLILPVNGTI